MAKKSKKLDIPDDWEIEEEEVPKEKKKREFEISNNMLWVLFIILVIGFSLLLTFWPKAPPKEMEVTYLNNIKISAPGDPVLYLRSLPSKHLVGKTLEEDSDVANNALLEIGSILGKTGLVTYGGKYNLVVGITDRTGIFLDEKSATIEGQNKEEFWNAVWTFTSTITNTKIDTKGSFYEIQDILNDREDVSLVIDMDGACTTYSYIISASGDILQATGYIQAREKYTIYQFNESEDVCELQFSIPTTNVTGCPEANETSLVINLKRANNNSIEVKENEINFYYPNCETLSRISVLLRDLLAPDVISGTREVVLPTEF